MSPLLEITPSSAVPVASFMTDGRIDPALCVAAALRALAPHLAAGMRVTSITCDLAPLDPEPPAEAQLCPVLEKATRSVAFARVEARLASGAPVFTIRALYSLHRQPGA